MLNFGCRNSKKKERPLSLELRPAARTAVCLSNAIVGEATSVRTKCLLQLSIHCGIVKLTKECQITPLYDFVAIFECPAIILSELAN